jgi:predicted DNA-binding protein
MMGGMEKTTVYLTTEQKRALERAAHAAGRSEARLIREGIEAVTAPVGAAETLTRLVDGRLPRTGDGGDTFAGRPRWMPRDDLVRLLRQGADASLRVELRQLAPDTTDDAVVR